MKQAAAADGAGAGGSGRTSLRPIEKGRVVVETKNLKVTKIELYEADPTWSFVTLQSGYHVPVPTKAAQELLIGSVVDLQLHPGHSDEAK